MRFKKERETNFSSFRLLPFTFNHLNPLYSQSLHPRCSSQALDANPKSSHPLIESSEYQMSISTREAKQTYHPGGYGTSEGLKRARLPFRTRNAIVGLTLSGFMFSVYLYSIRAVAQDDFADLQAPSMEEREKMVSIEEERRNRDALLLPPSTVTTTIPQETSQSLTSHQGILARFKNTFGGRGQESKIVWGAPPVDRLGRIAKEEDQVVTKRIV